MNIKKFKAILVIIVSLAICLMAGLILARPYAAVMIRLAPAN